MEITDEMREIARIVYFDRSSKRSKKSWEGEDSNSFSYQVRWGKQVFLKMYRNDRIKARKWAVSRFGSARARDLIYQWLI